MTPKWPSTLQGHIVPHVLLVSTVTYFTPFRSTTSRFWNTGHFETSAPNDPKLTLNPTLPYIGITTVPKSHCFALQATIFKLQAILRQVHWTTPKRPKIPVTKYWKCTQWPQTELEHLTVKSTLYTLNIYLWGPNFHPFCSTISCFRDTRSPKIGNSKNDPKVNLNI